MDLCPVVFVCLFVFVLFFVFWVFFVLFLFVFYHANNHSGAGQGHVNFMRNVIGANTGGERIIDGIN